MSWLLGIAVFARGSTHTTREFSAFKSTLVFASTRNQHQERRHKRAHLSEHIMISKYHTIPLEEATLSEASRRANPRGVRSDSAARIKVTLGTLAVLAAVLECWPWTLED